MQISILILLSVVLIGCTGSGKITGKRPAGFDKEGHRGCRGLMPENTIPGMLKAIDLDVTTLEMDVVISKDLKVVVSHDPYFHENITTTPEGKHLTKEEAAKRLLFNMNYDSIRKYDVGLKPHPDYPHQEKLPAHKPLLTDLLKATEKHARDHGKKIYYNIEIKSKPSGDGKKHPPVEQFADLVVSAMQKGGIVSRATIQSFDPRALQVMHKKYPGVPLALLIEEKDSTSLDSQLQELGFTPAAYSPHHSLVTPELINQCRKKNIAVVPWTVNDLELMRKLKQLGVDGIISDYPDLFSRL